MTNYDLVNFQQIIDIRFIIKCLMQTKNTLNEGRKRMPKDS